MKFESLLLIFFLKKPTRLSTFISTHLQARDHTPKYPHLTTPLIASCKGKIFPKLIISFEHWILECIYHVYKIFKVFGIHDLKNVEYWWINDNGVQLLWTNIVAFLSRIQTTIKGVCIWSSVGCFYNQNMFLSIKF